MAKAVAKPGYTTAEQLRGLTGYTARHLRDLAKDGWYPAPEHGLYQTNGTIKGLFDYQRDQLSKKDDTEKKARAAYWETKRKREQWEFDEAQDKFVALAELQPVLRNVLLHFRAVLQRTLETEMPSRLRNKTEIEMRDELKTAVDRILKILREGTSKWTAERLKQ
jgi:hypothetical protein